MGGGEARLPLNNQRPMIESHLGYHSDTDMESVAVADEQDYRMLWQRIGNNADLSVRDSRLDVGTKDSVGPSCHRRQLLEVL